MGMSPISVVEEMAKDIGDKSDVKCKFYESAEDKTRPQRTKFTEK